MAFSVSDIIVLMDTWATNLEAHADGKYTPMYVEGMRSAYLHAIKTLLERVTTEG